MNASDLERIEALTAIIREGSSKPKSAKVATDAAEEALSLLVTFTMVSSCLHTEALAADREAAALLLRRAAKGQWDTTSQALTTVADSISRGDHAR